MEITGIITLALVVVLVILFLWDRMRQERKWREQGDALSRTVGERIADTTRVFGEVKQSLGKLEEGTRQIEAVGRDLTSLQEVLRAPKFRGGLGELMLERLLEDVLPRRNYRLQYPFQSGEAVDAVIELGERRVPIDSKFPLDDFQRMLSAGSDAERASLRRQFVRTVRKHVDNVARYIRTDEGTFDFALMYIPAENVYYETILREGVEEGGVYSYALGKRVIPVSPNSFYAYLQVIILGLRGLHIEQAAREIQGQLGRLQGELTSFQDDFDTLGRHIRNAAGKHDEAARKLYRLGDRLKLAGETPVDRLSESTGGPSHQPDDS